MHIFSVSLETPCLKGFIAYKKLQQKPAHTCREDFCSALTHWHRTCEGGACARSKMQRDCLATHPTNMKRCFSDVKKSFTQVRSVDVLHRSVVLCAFYCNCCSVLFSSGQTGLEFGGRSERERLRHLLWPSQSSCHEPNRRRNEPVRDRDKHAGKHDLQTVRGVLQRGQCRKPAIESVVNHSASH